MSRQVTVAQAIKRLAEALATAGVEDATREARLIVGSICGIPRSRLTLSMQDTLDAGYLQALDEVSIDRLKRRPLSHILGYRAFFKHEFHVGPEVLDPRPETETLVVHALSMPFRRVLDLGTGSGAILLSLLAERSRAQGVGTDISQAALTFAGGNAEKLGLADRCAFVQSDWFEQVEGRFDLIVSNPPYIAADEMDGLAPELTFEPRIALTDEGDGLSAYRTITAGAAAHLQPGGRLMVEIGWQQGDAVMTLFEAAGFTDVSRIQDLDGRDRVISGLGP